MIALVLGIYVLAVMRLTRLINSDTILDTPRIAIARIFGPGSKVVEFFNCPWCVGMWIALPGAVGVGVILGWTWWADPVVGLACSQIVGMAEPLYRGEDIEFEPVSE